MLQILIVGFGFLDISPLWPLAFSWQSHPSTLCTSNFIVFFGALGIILITNQQSYYSRPINFLQLWMYRTSYFIIIFLVLYHSVWFEQLHRLRPLITSWQIHWGILLRVLLSSIRSKECAPKTNWELFLTPKAKMCIHYWYNFFEVVLGLGVHDTRSYFASKLCSLVASCIFQRLSNHRWKMDIWHAVQSPTAICIRFIVIVKENVGDYIHFRFKGLPVTIGSCKIKLLFLLISSQLQQLSHYTCFREWAPVGMGLDPIWCHHQ